MPTLIALDPQLDLPAADFVTAWNNSAHAADGTAVEEAPEQASFLPVELSVVLLTAVVAIPSKVIIDFVTEYLKKKYIDKKEEAPKVIVTTISMPDGQPVLIIKREEQ